MAITDYKPTVDDVARLIPSRAAAKFTGGAGAPAFPDTDRVQAVIDLATGTVASRLGGDALPAAFYEAAKALIVLRVALMLEPAAWPEQARPDKSAWDQWKSLYDDDLPALIESVKADAADGADGDGGPEYVGQVPLYSFPAPGLPVCTPTDW